MKALITIFTLLVFLSIAGCKKDNSFCGYKDPINEIAWLNDYVNNEAIIHCDVYKVIYRDMEGFYIETFTDSARSNSVSSFLDCNQGNNCHFGGALSTNCPDYHQHESYRELIYSR